MTKRLVEQYGDALICVRYRYDAKKHKQYKTVEVIVSESEWTPPPAKYPDGVLVSLKIGIKETDLQGHEEPWVGNGINRNKSGFYHMDALPERSWRSL